MDGSNHLPVQRDQLLTQRSETSMGELYLTILTFFSTHSSPLVRPTGVAASIWMMNACGVYIGRDSEADDSNVEQSGEEVGE